MRIEFEPNIKSRISRPSLRIEIDGVSYRPTDCSNHGFRLENYFGRVAVGEERDALVEVPTLQLSAPMESRVRVVECADGGVEFAWLDAPEILEGALQDLRAVESASEPTDARLPMPVPPKISSSPVEEKNPQPGLSLSSKLGIYCVASVLLITAVGYFAFGRLSTITVPDAVLMADFLPIRVPGSAEITKIAVRNGQRVEAGDLLFETDGGGAVSDLKSARARLQTARTELVAAQAQIEEEQKSLDLYHQVTQVRIDRQKVAIQKREVELARARRVLDRNKRLLEIKSVSTDDFAYAHEEHDITQRLLDQDRADLELLRLNDRATADGRYFDGRDVDSRLAGLMQEALVIQSRIEAAEQEVENCEARLKDFTARAPIAGTVLAQYHVVGERVSPAMTVLGLTTGEKFSVVGNLRIDEAARVQPGMKVDVDLPVAGVHLTGRVEAIGRRSVAAGEEDATALEVASTTIPCRIALDQAPPALTPGLRASLAIHLRALGRLR